MMEDLEDLDDLPAISLDSSVADVTVSFEMPDARTLAAQRKLASEQEAEIKRYQELMPPDDAEEPVDQRIVEIFKSIPVNTMPLENPGIDLTELNRMTVIDKFEGPKAVFLLELMEKLPQCNGKALGAVLNWYLDSIDRSVKESECIEAEDIHCNVVALSLVMLDKKCRNQIEASRVQALMMELLNRTGKAYQSEAFLNTLSEHLLAIVTHFHDRLVLAQLLNEANICPESLEQCKYFSSKLSISLTVSSLAQMLGHTRQVRYDDFTESDLKDLITNTTRWNVLSPYEQYYMMVYVMNLLKTYTLMGTCDSPDGDSEDILKELMLFISSMKSNEQWNNGEFLKVKNLIAKTKLFMQSKRMQESRKMQTE